LARSRSWETHTTLGLPLTRSPRAER
jgi:hypothetical protein